MAGVLAKGAIPSIPSGLWIVGSKVSCRQILEESTVKMKLKMFLLSILAALAASAISLCHLRYDTIDGHRGIWIRVGQDDVFFDNVGALTIR